MNDDREELSIEYKGIQTSVTAYSDGINTFFTIHLPGNSLQLKAAYIDGIASWVEDNGIATTRAEEIGRLIEEYDGR